MEEFFNEIIARTAEIPAAWAYATIVIITWLENVFPPVPGDVILAFGGALAARGSLDLTAVLGMAVLGGMIGFGCMYYLGRTGGRALLRSRLFRWIPIEPIDRAESWMSRYGLGVVAANRFLSGVRGVVAFVAGMSTLRTGPILGAALLSAMVWTALVVGAGYMVGDEWERIVGFIAQYGRVVATLVGVFLVYQVWKVVRRRRSSGTERV